MTHHPKTIIFDIETGPLPEPELLAMLPVFDPADVKCGNLGPEKAAAKIAEAAASHKQDFVDKAALDALTGRVLAIGMITIEHTDERLANGGGTFSIVADDDEAKLLRAFWELIKHDMGRLHDLIGFNVCKFDLPFLIRRSWKHGIGYPRGLRSGRYWGDCVIDLRDEWGCGDYMAKGSLDTISKHFGLAGKSGDGSKFAELWANDRQKAIAYLHNDLLLTSALAMKMGVL